MNPRITKLRKTLEEKLLDAVLISSLPNITYFTDFSGFSTEDRDAFLLITQKKHYIFTHTIYKEAVKRFIPSFELVEITREQPINELLKKICNSENLEKIGIENYDLTVAEYQKLCSLIPERYFAANVPFEDLRIIKSDEEIAALKKACLLGDKIFDEMLSEIKTNISEKQLAAILDFHVKQQNADISFPTIVAFGANAAEPHHIPDDTILEPNTFVLMDFGVCVDNYVSDMTRTVYYGKASDKEKEIYQTVYDAQNKAIELLTKQLHDKTAIKANEIDKIARDHIIMKNYPTMPHSLGHGIGLEVHEPPRLTPSSTDILRNGMVFSIEPGIYLPGDIGIRIEDLFAIQNNKLIQLTTAPRTLKEI